MEENYILFLGTGGSRHVMAEQLRSTGGTFFQINGVCGIIDPGPGALAQMVKTQPFLKPEDLSAVIISHGHLDHCNDVNLIIDSMTRGGLRKKGALFAPEEILAGEKQVLLNYLKTFLGEIKRLEPKKNFSLNGLTFSTSGLHQHGMETYGFSFNLKEGKLSFITDTAFFPGLLEFYQDSRWLVMNMVLERNCGNAQHLDIKGVKELILKIKPEIAVINHFGKGILRKGPKKVALQLEQETGIKKVIAPEDGERLNLI